MSREIKDYILGARRSAAPCQVITIRADVWSDCGEYLVPQALWDLNKCCGQEDKM